MKTNLIDLKSSPALAFPPEEWKFSGAPERLARIRKRLVENPRDIDLVRARLATESYRQTEGQQMPVRRAKVLLHLVREMPIAIDQDENVRRKWLVTAAHRSD